MPSPNNRPELPRRPRNEVIHEHRQARDVIEVSVGQKDMPDRVEIIEREIANTGARIDQHIVVDEHCGGARSRADTAAAT